MYLNPIKSLPWDKHTQNGDCPFILCIKFIGLYYKEMNENKTDEEIYLITWYCKQTRTHQQLLKLISDGAHLF